MATGDQVVAAQHVPSSEGRGGLANVRRFYLFEALGNFQLWFPIWVVYLQVQRGLSLTQIAVLESVFQMTIVATEVPTGAVADRWGRKLSLVLGAGGFVGAVLLFGLATNFWSIVVSYLAWGVTWTLRSGADSAFLYDTLAAAGQERQFSRVMGRVQAVVRAMGVTAGLLGAPLAAATTLGTPVLLSAVFAAAAFLVALTFQEPARREVRAPLPYLAVMAEAVRLSSTRRHLGAMILVVALLQGAVTAAHIFVQPFLSHYHVPVAAFGLLVIPIGLASIPGSLAAHRLVSRFGERAVLYAVAAGISGAYLVLGAVPSLLAYAAFPVIAFCAGAFHPVFHDYLGRHSPQHLRATVLSIASMASGLTVAVAGPALGWVADGVSLQAALLAGGAGLGLLAFPALAAWTAASGGEGASAEEAA